MIYLTNLFDIHGKPSSPVRPYRVDNNGVQGEQWLPARPVPYFNLISRLRDAWEVLRYRADALKWE